MLQLLNTIREIFVPNSKAHVDEDGNLFSPTGQFIATYSRRRDAVRGAKRRGFEVA